jgi:hypothetical protein
MLRSISLAVAAAITAALTALGGGAASAQHAAFTDPIGDGASGRYAGLDLTRYHVEYNDERVRVTLRFRNLTTFNFKDVVWYVNRSDHGYGQLGVVYNANGHVRRNLGARPCPGAIARVNRNTELAVLVAPSRCVGDTHAVRVLVGAEGRGGEDWTSSFRDAVPR